MYTAKASSHLLKSVMNPKHSSNRAGVLRDIRCKSLACNTEHRKQKLVYGTNPHAAKQPDGGIIKYTVVYRSRIKNCLKLTVQRTKRTALYKCCWQHC